MILIQTLNKCWSKLPSRTIIQSFKYRTLATNCDVLTFKLYSSQNNILNLSQRNVLRIIGSRNFRTGSCLYAEVLTVEVPPFAESVTEGDLRWIKSVGDKVSEDEPIGEVETDKTAVSVNAPCSGVIVELLVQDGTTVTPGTKIFKIQPGDAPASTEASKATPQKPPETPSPTPTPSAPPVEAVAAAAASPPASSPNPSTSPQTPPPPKSPMHSIPVAAIKHSSFIHQTEVKLPPADYSKEITGTRTEQRVKMSRMRLRIAQRLKEAQTVNAMLTTFNEIDMSNIMELRKSIGESFQKKHGFKLGFMSAFVNAAAYALKELPVVNAVIENQEIVYRDYVDISVAVATPKGLVVPVIRNAEGMNYADIEREIMKLGEKAKTGTLAVEDMDGGTFTISNGGVFGSLLGTPIINPPQSAILGMHGIFDRPVAVKGQVVIRPMMYIALTYDHRLIDGREAVTFLRKIKSSVEDPRTMLCGL